MRLATALVLVLATAQAALAAECRVGKGGHHLYWSWRLVDGRKCWYAGPPGVSKLALHWPRARAEARPARRPKRVPHPPDRPFEASSHRDVWPPLEEDPDVWPKPNR